MRKVNPGGKSRSCNDKNNSFAVSKRSFIGFTMNNSWIKRREIFLPISNCWDRVVHSSTCPTKMNQMFFFQSSQECGLCSFINPMCKSNAFRLIITFYLKFVNIDDIGQNKCSPATQCKYKKWQQRMLLHIVVTVVTIVTQNERRRKKSYGNWIGNGYLSLYYWLVCLG